MDNFKTYRIEDSGVMTPMVNVWMTHDEHEAYQEHLAKGNVLTIPFMDEPQVQAPEPQPIEFDEPKRTHISHASPHRGVYAHGKFKISVERMKEFLDSYEKFGGNYVDVAADLGIKPGSVSAYKSVAVRNGLLAGTMRSYNSSQDGKYAISADRAKEVATMYQILKGNLKRVARALGVTEGTARTYVNVARKRGLL